MKKLTFQELKVLKDENKADIEKITQGKAACGIGVVDKKNGVNGLVFRARTKEDAVRILKTLKSLEPKHPLYGVPFDVTQVKNIKPRQGNGKPKP